MIFYKNIFLFTHTPTPTQKKPIKNYPTLIRCPILLSPQHCGLNPSSALLFPGQI